MSLTDRAAEYAATEPTTKPVTVCTAKQCSEPSRYRAWFEECGACLHGYGTVDCTGWHVLCERHAVQVRESPPPWVGPVMRMQTLTDEQIEEVRRSMRRNS